MEEEPFSLAVIYKTSDQVCACSIFLSVCDSSGFPVGLLDVLGPM
jgi:hypothetical protein